MVERCPGRRMKGAHLRPVSVVVSRGALGSVASLVVLAVLYGGGVVAHASPPRGAVSFSAPSLFPSFGANVHDYVVRCNDAPLTVQGHASGGWEEALGNHPFRTGDFSEVVQLSAGRAFPVTAREASDPRLQYRYHVRCLPNDFPDYTFTRDAPV